MALTFTDGFDSYATTADLTKKWDIADSGGWAWSSTGGRTGAGCVVGGTTGGKVLRRLSVFDGATNRKSGIAFWVKFSGAPAAASDIFKLLDPSNSLAAALQLSTSGTLNSMFSNDVTTIVAGSANVCDNEWHWVEARMDPNTTNTFSQLWVDGVSQGSGTSFNASSFPSAIQFLSVAGITIYIDDVIACDNVGTYFLSTAFPLGPRQISTLRPNADGATQFTPSSGVSNYALVDEISGDVSDYVESGTSGDQDTYEYSDLGFTPTEINAVMVNSYVQNPNAGTINYQQIAKSNVSTATGASTKTPSSPKTAQAPFYTDPDTSVAWTAAGVNAAQFGIKVA